MRTIYIDSNYICHADDDGTRTAIETDAFDNVCDVALECYKFIPAHEGKVDFIQCFDSVTADKLQKQNDISFQNGQMDILDFVEQQLGVLQ